MAEVDPGVLRSFPAAYKSSRAVNDVLLGVDRAPPLFEASSAGDIPALRKILDDTPEMALESPHRIYQEDRPAKDKDDVRRVLATPRSNLDRAILRAAENGHVEAVSVLLEFASQHSIKPLSVIDRDTVKATIENRHAAVFDVLATAEPEIATHPDIHPQMEPLDWAMKLSDIELVRVILRHGGGARRWHASIYTSRLSTAARKDKIFLELLLQEGHSVKNSGALHAAASAGKVENIRLLVEEHGADVNEPLPKASWERGGCYFVDWTPLHFAANLGREDAMKLLESYGANVDAVDTKGRTPSQLAQEWKDSEPLRLAARKSS